MEDNQDRPRARLRRIKRAFTFDALAWGMMQIPTPARSRSDALALMVDVERAGLAWACPFSSSAEFEAAIIRARREAGVYGPKRTRRNALLVMAGFGAAAALIALACLLI
jgi:hypothetical protein